MTVDITNNPDSDKPTAPWCDIAVEGCLFVGTLALYVATAARHVQGGDAGEFALITHGGGFAHPPGYPLFSLYLQGFGTIPGLTAAHAGAIATSLLGAAAVAATYWAARRWRRSVFASLVCALGFGLAADVWLFQTVPEVFALNHLLAAIIVGLSCPDTYGTANRRAFGLSLAFGLGLANHLSIVFLLPIVGYGLWRACRASQAADERDTFFPWSCLHVAPFIALGLATGLSPYL
jgi:hypothetical protein